MTPFDPYEAWLEIPPEEQPADHYRLLGLARFETDLGRIAAAADQRMARVRSYQMGPRGAYTQKILNELATARVHLLDAADKAQYDRELAAHLASLQAARRSQAAALHPEPPPVATPAAQPDAATPHERSRFNVSLAITLSVVALGLAAGVWAMSQHLARARNAAQPKPSPVVKPKSREAARPPLIRAGLDGLLICRADNALLSGGVTLVRTASGPALEGWNSPTDEARWALALERPGFYQAEIDYAATQAAEDLALELRLGERTRLLSLRPTGGLDVFESDVLTVAIERRGEHSLSLRASQAQPGPWLRLRSVRLVPMGADAQP
jgi:hypothetical protein